MQGCTVALMLGYCVLPQSLTAVAASRPGHIASGQLHDLFVYVRIQRFLARQQPPMSVHQALSLQSRLTTLLEASLMTLVCVRKRVLAQPL